LLYKALPTILSAMLLRHSITSRRILMVTGFTAALTCVTTSIHLIVSSFATPLTSGTGDWEYSVKVGTLAVLYIASASALAVASTFLFKGIDRHAHIVDGWSRISLFGWIGGVAFLLAIYYPVPYVSHHADKLYILLCGLLLWVLAFIFMPGRLLGFLDSVVFRNTQILLVNIVLAVVVSEVAIRAAAPILSRHGTFDTTHHSPLGLVPHRPTAGSIQRLNSQGFRDRERTFSRTVDAPRIVALGDSFTVGVGVSYDDGFIARIEKALQEVVPGTEVINLGVGGFQPDEYLSVLKAMGIQYSPDLVLMNFYVGNDFEPSPQHYIVFAGLRWKVHVNGNWFHDHFSPDHWNLGHALTYVYRVGRGRLGHWLGFPQEGFWDAYDDTPMGAAKTAGAFTGWNRAYVRSQGHLEQFLKKDTLRFQSLWNRTRHTLEECKRLLDSHHIPWMLILLPSEVQIDDGLQAASADFLRISRDDFNFDKPQEILHAWAESNSVVLLDLTPAFRAGTLTRRLYLNNDGHWNPAGHETAAAALFPALQNWIATHHNFTTRALNKHDAGSPLNHPARLGDPDVARVGTSGERKPIP
jgi:lysophospholipase L1-like esterase